MTAPTASDVEQAPGQDPVLRALGDMDNGPSAMALPALDAWIRYESGTITVLPKLEGPAVKALPDSWASLIPPCPHSEGQARQGRPGRASVTGQAVALWAEYAQCGE